MKKFFTVFSTLQLCLTGSVMSQDLVDCPTCFVGAYSEVCINASSLVTILNCSSITSANGFAGGFALENGINYSRLESSCDPDGTSIADIWVGLTSEPSADAGVMVNGSLSVGGGAGVPKPGENCGISFGFTANLGGGKSCSISSSLSSRNEFESRSVSQDFSPFELLGNEYNGEFGSASLESEVEINASAPLQLLIEVSTNSSGVWVPINTCMPGPLVNPGPAQNEAEILSGTYYTLSVGGVSVASGLIASKPEEPLIRLGIFADQSLTQVDTASSTSLTGTYSVSHTTASSGAIDIEENRLSYSVVMGDVNDDGFVTHCDKEALLLLNGSILGDSTYDPRGDMDIDGDIDFDDLARAEIEFEVAISNYDCKGDHNGDGVVDFFDVSKFIQDLQDNSPLADYNCDGQYDFFDNSAFLIEFGMGCP